MPVCTMVCVVGRMKRSERKSEREAMMMGKMMRPSEGRVEIWWWK